MRGIRDEYGLNMTCGASNVSFGMPGRARRSTAPSWPMAMTAGLTSAIMDTRTAADRRGGQGRRPAARPRRVGDGVDRAPPRAAGRGQAAAVDVTDADAPELADLPLEEIAGARA